MNLSGIISISGKPGLYKVVAQGKNNIIVESLVDKKRSPAYSTDRISSLDDISVYTTEEDAPLKGILEAIYKKENGQSCPSHKEDLGILTNYLKEILPNYDEERVYPSDIKKIFQWYNLLLSSGNLESEDEETSNADAQEENDSSKESKKISKTDKKEPVKTVKATKAVSNDKAKVTKSAAPKKTATTKTGSSRGK